MKSSPSSTLSSSSPKTLLGSTCEGNSGPGSIDRSFSGVDQDITYGAKSSLQKIKMGPERISHSDESVVNYLGRVRQNNEIIITSIPRSPTSSNSSSKEEFDELRENLQQRKDLHPTHTSSNDKGLPQTTFADSVSSTLISRINCSSSSITHRGELLISPASNERLSNVDAPIADEKDAENAGARQYVLALSPPIPSEYVSAQKQTSDPVQQRNSYDSLKILNLSSYSAERQHRELSPPNTRIPLSLSDRLDSDCSRLLSSKRDLIIERVIPTEQDKGANHHRSPSTDDFTLGQKTDQKTDYDRNKGK